MLVEELYSSYFDVKCNRLPYSNDREYLTDLLAFGHYSKRSLRLQGHE